MFNTKSMLGLSNYTCKKKLSCFAFFLHVMFCFVFLYHMGNIFRLIGLKLASQRFSDLTFLNSLILTDK